MEELLTTFIYVAVQVGMYILAGYYAANAKWCGRKVIVSALVGIGIILMSLYTGTTADTAWINAAFNSGAALGAMYMIDRFIKGLAKRFGWDWLYTDEPCEV